MSIEQHRIDVSGIPVDVVRKDIRNLHLGVYPPMGRVRVAAPLRVDDEAVRMAVISRLGWIRRKQAEFERQDRQSQREMVTGESHWFRGRRYRLQVVEHVGPSSVRIVSNRTMEMRVRAGDLRVRAGDLRVRAGSDQARRQTVLDRWYRMQLRTEMPGLITKWESIIGVRVADWGIRRMKTRWGTCNAEAGRIRVNLELAKKPQICLEYIIVHEMVHLLERNHNERFRELMDTHMPAWRMHRDELNRAPLAHEEWEY